VTDWSLLGGNPAPGSPGVFEGVARVLAPIVDHSESSSSSVRTMAQQAGSSSWSGTAAETFAEAVYAIPNDLGDLVLANQRAISALNTYSETLTTLQSQATQVLTRAQSDQNNINSASTALGAAEASYVSADAEYEYFRVKVDVLEGEKFVAGVAGDHAEAARLEAEILSASQSRNAAWNQRNDASQRISTSQSALRSAQKQLADEQTNANRIAAQRNEAIGVFVGQMNAAADFVVGQRSWFDRVRQDFDSVAGIAWSAAEGILGIGHSNNATSGTAHSTEDQKDHAPSSGESHAAPTVVAPGQEAVPLSAAAQSAIAWASNQSSNGGIGALFDRPNSNCLGFVTQAYSPALPDQPQLLADLSQHGLQPVSPGDGVFAQDLYNYYKVTGVSMSTSLPPPKGALVFYNYTGYAPGQAPAGAPDLGHVGISLGNGQIICTQDIPGLPGVATVSAVAPNSSVLQLSDGAKSWCTFEGWCMPPS